MTTPDQIKNAIRRSGISVREAAVLFGVTRVAVHNWMKGGMINPLRKSRVARVVKALNFAVEDAVLPLGTQRLRGEPALNARLQLIQRIVLSRLRQEDVPPRN